MGAEQSLQATSPESSTNPPLTPHVDKNKSATPMSRVQMEFMRRRNGQAPREPWLEIHFDESEYNEFQRQIREHSAWHYFNDRIGCVRARSHYYLAKDK